MNPICKHRGGGSVSQSKVGAASQAITGSSKLVCCFKSEFREILHCLFQMQRPHGLLYVVSTLSAGNNYWKSVFFPYILANSFFSHERPRWFRKSTYHTLIVRWCAGGPRIIALSCWSKEDSDTLKALHSLTYIHCALQSDRVPDNPCILVAENVLHCHATVTSSVFFLLVWTLWAMRL